MCGLVGMVGTLEYKHKQTFKELLFLNSLRGKDSTGISAVRRDRTVCTRKMTVPGYEFIEHPAIDKAMVTGDQLWMGHGRYKTIGDVNKANAHPFEVMDDNEEIWLVGTHNGSLTNKWELERKLNGDKFDTDSETLFNWLVEAPNYKEAIKALRGAWSLVWWDPIENSLHFCRNKERPLVYAYSKDHKVLVYASESWMIINACRRNGVELDKNDKGLSCYATNVDTLYTLEIPQEKDKELPELKREGGYIGAPTPVNRFQGEQGAWDNWKHWWDDEVPEQEREKKAASRKKETETNGEKKQDVIIGLPPRGEIKGFQGESLTLAQFDKIRARGCAWCKDEFKKETPFGFLDEENLVCFNCLRDRHSKTGECVRPDVDYDPVLDPEPLDDDLPLDLQPPAENSAEYKAMVAEAAKSSVG